MNEAPNYYTKKRSEYWWVRLRGGDSPEPADVQFEGDEPTTIWLTGNDMFMLPGQVQLIAPLEPPKDVT